jgi:CAAX protease family protein
MPNDSVDPAQATRWFWRACAFEGALAALAFLLAPLFSLPPAGNLRWRVRGAAWGLVGTLPLLGLLALLLKVRWRWMQEIIDFFDRIVRPLLGQCSLPQLGALSLLAGFGEELLFRALIQGGCSRLIGLWPALAAASLLFGVFHWVTRAYALLAGAIGAYLGLLWIISGNLLAPIITHAVYDFIALVYFLRAWPGPLARPQESHFGS